MKGHRIVTRGALALFLGVVLIGCTDTTQGGGESGLPEGNIRLGLLLPLTGDLAQPGGWIQTAINFAVDEINEAGGVAGRQIEVIVQDDAGDPTQDVTLVNQLINQRNVHLVYGPITTDGMKAVLPALTRANVASIGVVGSPTLTPDVMPLGFSILLNAGDQVAKMMEHAGQEGYGSVAVLHDSGEQGRTAGSLLEENVPAEGMELAGVQQYDVGDTDMTAQLLTLQRKDPEALLLFPTTGSDVGNVLLGMDQLGMNIPVIGGYAAHFAGAIAEVAGDESLENVVATAYASHGACPGEGVLEGTGAFASGLEEFDPKVFADISIDLAAAARDGVWVLKAAIEGAESVDGRDVASWLEENSATLGENLVNASVAASPESHFLFSKDAIGLVRPSEEVAKGVFERVDC